jgi:hypothetical protein
MAVATPQRELPQLRKLVEEHRQLADEPLLLAVYFEPKRNPEDVFLFEIIDGFAGGRVDEERKLFEVSYSGTESFPMMPGKKLHLVLTNPTEFEAACQEDWPSLREIREAVKAGHSETLYVSQGSDSLEAKLNG